MNQGLIPTSEAVYRLIQEFNKLPGIGPKSAQRLTYYLLRAPEEQARLLAEAVLSLKQKTMLCSVCLNVTDSDPCPLCRSNERDRFGPKTEVRLEATVSRGPDLSTFTTEEMAEMARIQRQAAARQVAAGAVAGVLGSGEDD